MSRQSEKRRSPAAVMRSRRSTSTAEPACLLALVESRRLRRSGACTARRSRAAGEARDRECLELRRARADVRLHRRGARECARGERRVHVHPCALDHGSLAPCRPRVRPRRAYAEAARARCAAPRHRQDRHPERRALEAGTADGGGAEDRPDAPGARRADHRPDRPAAGRAADRPPLPRALGRPRLPGWCLGRGHPARVADHLRLRRVPRDDHRPAVPAGPQSPRGVRRLGEGAGSQFDPNVVEVALRVLEQPAEVLGVLRLAGDRQIRLSALERVREAAERAVDPEQLLLGSALDDLPVLDDEDLVGAADGRKAVGDDDRGAALAAAGREPARSAPRSGGRCSRSPRRARGSADRRATRARSR